MTSQPVEPSRADLLAAAVAHDSHVARALDRMASFVVRAWRTSATRRELTPRLDAFRALPHRDRALFVTTLLGTALATHLLLVWL